MKYLIVSGSPRPNSQSIRIAAWLERELQKEGDETVVIDLSEAYVPENIDALDEGESKEAQQFQPSRHYLDWCDGLVVISPEWNGMTPGKLISFMQSLKRSVAHKPGLIVTTSAYRGGAYPSTMLRAFATKNSHVLWLPEQLIVRGSEDMFHDNTEEKDDLYIQKRARYDLSLLRKYTEILAPQREKLLDGLTDFPNGM